MAFSLSLIIVLGLLFNKIFKFIKLPGLIGMLLLGILIGPYGLNWLSDDLLRISDDFRKIALIVILLRAGIGLNKETLKKVGKSAILLSIIPCLLEGSAIILMAIWLFDFSFIEGGLLGFIIAAVSPAVVVPAMLDFKDRGIGDKKGITTLILAGSSVDDIFAITIFSGFMGLYSATKVSLWLSIVNIGISIVLGITLGLLVGLLLVFLFKKLSIRNTKKVLLLIGIAIFMTTLESFVSNIVPISALLGVMTIGFLLLEKLPNTAKGLSDKLGKVWIFAEILLFVLVGAKVNILVALDSGLLGLAIISVGLLFRSIGVLLSTWKSDFTVKERLFCVISFIPKATVQAAIGAIPLIMGVPSGELILAIAVLSIIITAPIGAIGIKNGAKRLLT
ncbi:MAG: cation:proton antiporter [Clostridiales bacterium]|nr:cation:proton antiporter [Clostridiales bacterium]